MREINAEGINLIKTFEGFSSVAYNDIAGLRTIGYGHALKPGESFTGTITQQDAEELLKHDLRIAESSVLKLIKIPLTDNQFSALVSFTFNLGGGSLQRSTLRRKINRGEKNIKDEWLKWCFAGRPPKKSIGLLKRRIAEYNLYCS